MADTFTPEQVENMNRFFELVNSSLTPLTEAQKEEAELAKKAKEAKDKLDGLTKSLQKSGADFTRALISGQDGFSKFGDSVNSASSAIGGMAVAAGNYKSVSGVLLKVTGHLIEAFGTFVDSALKQNDNLMKGFESLSSIGGITKNGLDNLRTSLHTVGLTVAEYDKLIDTLKPVVGSLNAFGGSVNDGREKLVGVIGQFIGVNNPLELSLRRIGYSTQDIREGVADYVQLQTRLGRAQGKSVQELAKESQKYLIEMKGLQELTGMTRDEQQKARDAQMADARFSLHLTGLKETEQKNLQAYMIAYEKSFGPEAAAGLKDRIVNFGAITTEAGAASFQRGNQEYELAMKAQSEGIKIFEEALVTTAQNTKTRLDSLEGTFRFTEGGLNSMGLTNKMVNGTLMLVNTNSKNYAKNIRELIQTSFLQDKQAEDNFKSDQMERAKRLAMDDALGEAGKILISIFTKLKEVMYEFAKMMAKIVDYLTAKFGSYVNVGPTNLSQFFTEYEKAMSQTGRASSATLSPAEATRSSENAERLSRSMQDRDAQEILSRLNLGNPAQRAERIGGGNIDPTLIGLAEKISEQYGGVTFTAFNDLYHHRGGRSDNKRSRHTLGKALDFAFPYTPDDDEANDIMKTLRLMGASNVINEYKSRSGNWTGGHFHVEIARQGGLFSGKESGYPVMLHGKNESVWPEKDLTSFMKDVQKTSLEQYKQELMGQLMSSGSGNSNNTMIDAFKNFSTKLDILISEQRKTNGYQDEILTYTRA